MRRQRTIIDREGGRIPPGWVVFVSEMKRGDARRPEGEKKSRRLLASALLSRTPLNTLELL